MSIFVSIASYKDPETIPTVIDCYNKAKHKRDIRFGVLLQEDNGYSNKSLLDPNINIDFIEFDWRDSQGACWARHNIQKLFFNNEDYYLQLDSHHRFIENWDEKLINDIKILQLKYKKPIIGGYCPGYKPSDDKNLEDKPMKITAFPDFTDLGDLMFMPKVIKNYEKLRTKNINYIKARFLSGHFIFATTEFVKECPYDPLIYFRGEELSLSARAYTYGYDFFHPTTPIVWHEYIRADQIKHWNDHTKDNGFLTTSDKRSSIGKGRVRQLLGMENSSIKFTKYGLGKKRSLHEYELYAGLNFAQRTVHKYAYNINDNAPNPYVMSESDWSEGMLKKCTVEFDMPKNYISNLINKVDSIAFIFYDHKNQTSYRKDIKNNNLQLYSNDIIRISASMESRPIRLSIAPFSLKKEAPIPMFHIRSLRIIE
jgi:hypothetical protein